MSDSLRPPAPLRPDLSAEWMLEPGVDFLNHGSFGAVPRAVFDVQEGWRRRVEAKPIELIGRRWGELMRDAKAKVAPTFAMSPDDFGFVTNATEGVNAVLGSIELKPGDELVTTTHVYNAVRQAMRRAADRAGAGYRELDVPLPVRSAADVTRAVAGGLTHRTRLLVVDHVTSPTAIVFPVGEIAAECAARGVDLLVDGAHAPGMLDLDIPAVGATYYAGNLHKWCCAPKGTGVLWVRPDCQSGIHPAVVSHHLGEGFAREFEWQGTRDPSAWLTAPAALAFMSELGGTGGWPRVRAHNHAMAAWAHALLCDRWDARPISPRDGSLLGSMASVPLPPRLQTMSAAGGAALQQRLYDEHRVEVPLTRWNGVWLLRVSCSVYNVPAQYERVADLIADLGA